MNSSKPFFCSVYKPDQVYFGGFPTQEWYQILRSLGINIFVDLTTRREKQTFNFSYHQENDIMVIHYPIRDNHIPMNPSSFMEFILTLSNLIQNGQKMYLHCKGGHGRSGLVVASLMCFNDNINPQKALERTTVMHLERPNLKPKYLKSFCPDNYVQRRFVLDNFNPFNFSEYYQLKSLYEFINLVELRPLEFKTNPLTEIFLFLRKKILDLKIKKKTFNKTHSDDCY